MMEQENPNIFKGLNTAQYQAVKNIEGPSLIIAGAGSGKTKVLTCRIANILDNGHAPESILALTFTNKASKEMKLRIASLVGEFKARRLWMGTFHSIFIRFLREEAELLGFPKAFTIYDTTDSRSVIKACIKELQLDDKIYKPNEVHSRISMAKNNLVTAEAYARNNTLIQNDTAAKKPRVHEIYQVYAKKCKMSGAMDFDDILVFTNILFRDFPDALQRIKGRFKFIMVDEYQDTNFSQYLIIKKLSQEHRNISVVGDDAQSIYSFRGARIENILNFKQDYPDAKEYRLEQNYRSTQTIVNAANSLIARNKMQLKKKCFSQHENGELIELINAFTEQEEGFMVAGSILEQMHRVKEPYSSFAILYRTNAQSRVIEEALRRKNMPYKIFAGHSFYDRAEVKDMLAYLRLVANEKDDEAFKRIVNFPARGIGDTSLGKLRDAANAKDISLSEAVKNENLEEFGLKAGAIQKIKSFVAAVEQVREKLPYTSAFDIAMEVNMRFGILDFMKQENSLEAQGRVENVEELFNSIKEFVEEGELEHQQMADQGYEVPIITLDLYLENVSLLSDTDTKDKEEDKNKIALMTVHSSKGLEFPYVYIIGMEENLFPAQPRGGDSEQEIEEERRLFYVALTRAEKGVKLSFAHSRIKWGSHVSNPPSRFLKEIDKQYLSNPLTDFQEELQTRFDTDPDDFAGGGFLRKATPERSASGSTFRRPGEGSRTGFGGSGMSGSSRTGSGQRSSGIPTERPAFSKPAAARPADPNFTADPPAKMAAGQTIEHERFGFGLIVSIEGDPLNLKAIVDFQEGGRKTLLLKFAKIRIIT